MTFRSHTGVISAIHDPGATQELTITYPSGATSGDLVVVMSETGMRQSDLSGWSMMTFHSLKNSVVYVHSAWRIVDGTSSFVVRTGEPVLQYNYTVSTACMAAWNGNPIGDPANASWLDRAAGVAFPALTNQDAPESITTGFNAVLDDATNSVGLTWDAALTQEFTASDQIEFNSQVVGFPPESAYVSVIYGAAKYAISGAPSGTIPAMTNEDPFDAGSLTGQSSHFWRSHNNSLTEPEPEDNPYWGVLMSPA